MKFIKSIVLAVLALAMMAPVGAHAAPAETYGLTEAEMSTLQTQFEALNISDADRTRVLDALEHKRPLQAFDAKNSPVNMTTATYKGRTLRVKHYADGSYSATDWGYTAPEGVAPQATWGRCSSITGNHYSKYYKGCKVWHLYTLVEISMYVTFTTWSGGGRIDWVGAAKSAGPGTVDGLRVWKTSRQAHVAGTWRFKDWGHAGLHLAFDAYHKRAFTL